MTALDDENNGDEKGNKSFLDHLDDLRSMLLWSLVSVIVGMLIAIPLSPFIFKLLSIPLIHALKDPAMKYAKDPESILQGGDFMGLLTMALSTIFWTGLIISMPFVLYFVSRFVFPGLKKKERDAVLGSLGFATILFVIGIAVGCQLLGVTIKWMFLIGSIYGIKMDFILASAYVGFVLKFLLALGLAFEYPVVVIALWKIGLITFDFIKSKRRHMFVIMLIVSGLITPTVDPATQFMLAIPLYVLYEICIAIIWLMERGTASKA